MKKFLFASILILLVLSVAVSVSAEDALLLDGANLLTDTEEKSLLSILEGYSNDVNTSLAVVTVESYDGYNIEKYTEKLCDDGFMSDGIVLLLSMDTGELCLTRCGSTETAIDKTGLDYIRDTVSPYLSDGDYYVAFSVFAELSRRAILEYNDSGDAFGDGGFLPSVEVLDDGTVIVTEGSRPMSHYVTCLVIGLVLALIAMFIMQSGMKTVRSQDHAGNYIVSDSLKIRVSTDRFLYRTVTKTPRPKSNNSSGGYRGGGSGRSSSGRF